MIDGLLGHQIGVAFLITAGIETIKRLPFINLSIGTIRILATILAAMASVGFAISLDGTWAAGGHVVIAFPNGHVIWDFVMHLSTQLGLSEGAYRGLIKPVVGTTPPLEPIELEKAK